MPKQNARIVHMAAYGGPYPGTFIPMLAASRDAVEAHGWSFGAVFTSGVERYEWYAALCASGVKTLVAPTMGLRAATGWVRSLLRDQTAPTLLHTAFSRWDVPAALAARRRDAAVVWHLHSPLHEEPVARLRNVVRFGAIARNVDRILCVSPEIRDKAVGRMAPADRTELFPNAIDVDRFLPIEEGARSAARSRLDLPPEIVVLLLFGWDWERKGGTLLIETVQELRRRGRDVLAIVVGSEPQAREAAQQHGVASAIRTMQPFGDSRVLYAVADLFISASTAEGMPFSVLEALSCGTPVVASDIPSHRYVARNLPACRLAERTAAEFSDAIEIELDVPAENRRARLEQSRRQIELHHSLVHWSDRLIATYSQVLARRFG
jgi:glycosyltransferase involved in cell wall biosynthesis